VVLCYCSYLLRIRALTAPDLSVIVADEVVICCESNVLSQNVFVVRSAMFWHIPTGGIPGKCSSQTSNNFKRMFSIKCLPAQRLFEGYSIKRWGTIISPYLQFSFVMTPTTRIIPTTSTFFVDFYYQTSFCRFLPGLQFWQLLPYNNFKNSDPLHKSTIFCVPSTLKMSWSSHS